MASSVSSMVHQSRLVTAHRPLSSTVAGRRSVSIVTTRSFDLANCSTPVVCSSSSSSSRSSSRGCQVVAAGKDSGGGVMDKPVVAPTPGRESEFDLTKQRKRSPLYRVMLHNDNFNRREYVVQVLMKVIPGMTVDTAVNVMQEAHVNGLACVITCPQEEAEDLCLNLRSNGLISSIEPASTPGAA